MSRNEQRIRKLAAARGIDIEDLYWEPVHNGGLFEGPCGGWLLTLDRSKGKRYGSDRYPNLGNDQYIVGGLSTDELLENLSHITVHDSYSADNKEKGMSQC